MSDNRPSPISIPDGFPSGLLPIARRPSLTSIDENFVVGDERLSRGFPIRRHVRIVCGQETAWWSHLIPHLAGLMTREMRHVDRFLEVGPVAEGLYLVSDDHPSVLADLIGPEPIAEPTATVILSQIARGLAELHQYIGPHGDLSVRSIRVNKSKIAPDVQVSIGDTELGRLALWSNFTLVSSGFQQSRPPEWKGDRTDQFTKEGDVYALGLIGAEMLLGSANYRAAHQTAANSKSPFVKVVQSALRDQGVSPSIRRKIERLLATNPAERPRDGHAAVELLSSTNRERRGWLVAAAVGLLIIMLGVSRPPAQHRSELKPQEHVKELEGELEDSTSQVVRLTSTLDQIQQELDIARLSAQANQDKLRRIADLVVRPIPDLISKIREVLGTKDDAVEVAQWRWRELQHDRPISEMLDELERLRREGTTSDEQITLLKGWVGLINRRQANWSAWISRRRPEESSFVEAWIKYWHAPWDETLQQSADQTSDALWTASRIWWEYASANKSRSWDDFRRNLETEAKAQPNALVEKVLAAWIAEFQRRDSWTLRLGNAKGEAGSGRWRLLSVYLDGKWQQEDWREWSRDVAHDYESAEIPLAWHPGQPVEILIEGERSYLTGTRPNLIDQSFGGPVALWSLHQAGAVKSTGFALEIDLGDCPGPPRSLIQSLRKKGP